MRTTQSILKRAVVAAITSALVLPAFALSSPASAAKNNSPRISSAWSQTFLEGGTSSVSGVKVDNAGSIRVLVAIGAVATGSGAKAFLRSNATPVSSTFGWAYGSDPVAQKAGNNGAGLDTLQFYGTQDEVNSVLNSIQLTTTAGTTGVQIKSMATEYKESLVYYPRTEHFYKFVRPLKTDGTLNDKFKWSEAKAAAEASTELGLTGYLANITSAEENEYVTSRISPDGTNPAKNVWLGGAVADANYEWKWAGGPEKDTIFYKGCESSAGTRSGSSPTGYHGFSDGEPNNYASSTNKCSTTTIAEGCLLTNNKETTNLGEWNDFPCNLEYSYPKSEGYVVEYGNKPTGGDFTSVAFSTSRLNRAIPITRPTFLQTFAKGIGRIKANVLSTFTAKQKKKTVTKQRTQVQAKVRLFKPGIYDVFVQGTQKFLFIKTNKKVGLRVRNGSTVDFGRNSVLIRNNRFRIRSGVSEITFNLILESGKKGVINPTLILRRVIIDPITRQESYEYQSIPPNWKAVFGK